MTVIDRATFDELRETAGEDFVAELVGTFQEEAPQMLAELRAALAAGDAPAFKRAAHSLKSNSATFGATRLAAQARELELGGLPSGLAAGDRAMAELEAAYAQASQALTELARG